MTSTALARTQQQAETTVQSLVRDNWQAIAQSLPSTMDPKRFARLVFNSVRRTPKLAQCTATSLVGSLLASSVLGVEVDTPLGEAYLVPYGSDAQLIIGYQGIVKLYRQHPMAGSVSSGWVGERDRLEYAYGTKPFLNHFPALGDRGAPVAVWASYTLKDGTTDFVVLSMDEVRELRGKVKKGDIADPQQWMARKTALKQVLKLAPKSTQLAAALVIDEQPVGDVHQVSGLESVAASVAALAAHESTAEHVDPDTGEVHEAELVEPNPPAEPQGPRPLTRTTGNAVLAEFKRLGVEAAEVDAWLPAVGIPVGLRELSQPDAEELLVALRALDRDRLAELAREAQGASS